MRPFSRRYVASVNVRNALLAGGENDEVAVDGGLLGGIVGIELIFQDDSLGRGTDDLRDRPRSAGPAVLRRARVHPEAVDPFLTGIRILPRPATYVCSPSGIEQPLQGIGVMEHKTDGGIQKDVLQELHWDSRVDETDVGVEVDDGIVTLTGTVDSYAKRIAAQEAAHRVGGVLDVANDIEVKAPGKGKLTDTEIAREVRDTLQWNVFVDDEKIVSTVHDGYVTLEGKADSLHAREEVAGAVRSLSGVRAVINRITVESTPIDPTQVRSAIEAALKRRAESSAHGVHVSIDDHAVVLEGRVPSWTEKQTILDAAGHMRGITKIVDHVNITPLSESKLFL